MHRFLKISFTSCSGCSFKTYGEDCKMSCGFCKDNDTCDHINGSCSNGCTNGWSGEKCDIGEYTYSFESQQIVFEK